MKLPLTIDTWHAAVLVHLTAPSAQTDFFDSLDITHEGDIAALAMMDLDELGSDDDTEHLLALFYEADYDLTDADWDQLSNWTADGRLLTMLTEAYKSYELHNRLTIDQI